MQFQLYICISLQKLELNITYLFLSSRGITLSKIIRPGPNSNFTCIILWRIHILNSYVCANVGQIINRKSILTEWLIDRMTERGNFFDILWQGDKTCFKTVEKEYFFFIIQLSKHSVGLFKLEFQQNMLNISKKVESKPNKLEKLMYNGKFSNLKLHFLKFHVMWCT